MTNFIGAYRGWAIYYDSNAPVTSKWKAIRLGVSMNAADKDAILRMVDRKADEGKCYVCL